MDINEIKAYIEQNKDNEEVQQLANSFITPDRINGFLEGEDGKKLLQPKMDKYFNKGLESWKANNLNSIVETEVSKRFPAETPESKQLREMQEKLNNMESQTAFEKRKGQAIKSLNEKGLPVGLADYFHADTDEGIGEVISYLEIEWKNAIEKSVTEKLKGHTPPASQSTGADTTLTKEKIASLPVKDRMKIFNENPELWNKIMNS